MGGGTFFIGGSRLPWPPAEPPLRVLQEDTDYPFSWSSEKQNVNQIYRHTLKVHTTTKYTFYTLTEKVVIYSRSAALSISVKLDQFNDTWNFSLRKAFVHTEYCWVIDTVEANDTTLSEFINKGEPSRMDVNLTQLMDWSSSNYMKVNVKKKKVRFSY